MKPQSGDTLKCNQCGMELEVKAPCNCADHDPTFECCGKPLQKA